MAFGLVTALALEASEVAGVTTRTATGERRSTHVWYVEREGALWLEAGSPHNPWFVDSSGSIAVRLEPTANR